MRQLRYKCYKIKQDIINLIKTGKLLPGEIVPSETKLIKKYDVSRITARKALDDLPMRVISIKYREKVAM
ncbi:GntR family transcriptional regulator [Brachyspira aalborgi]|uniref:GntR family transcriptional regulator n=1 Tax=Brachyspira aalborgi TaxID=29522 RepID=A0A5C8CL37_9SPIR|nr:GntR family transcriptional regulator [Brachyspira aalborgi]